jgi:hypothetical protein
VHRALAAQALEELVRRPSFPVAPLGNQYAVEVAARHRFT